MEVEALRESLDQLKLLRTQAEGLIGRISNNFKTDALLNVGIAKEAIDILQKTIIEQEKILSVQELTDINKISYMADVEKAIDEYDIVNSEIEEYYFSVIDVIAV